MLLYVALNMLEQNFPFIFELMYEQLFWLSPED